ncbi:MAG: protease modulator HflC [Candidatus Aminicenantes bacterium]|nr:protease modulator HflC [Candidatus Aminicenantes bacterium]
MKVSLKTILLAGLLLVVLIVLSGTLYIVTETNQVIITQFGKPIGDMVTRPGVHLKMPFIQKANFFEKRWLEWDGDPNQIPTRDKKYIWVDTYARWRISNPLVFFQRVRDERGAYSRLDDILDGETRNAVANAALIEIVRTSNRPFEITGETAILQTEEELESVSLGRDKISRIILEKAAAITPEFGIELRDLQVKRVNYIEEVQQKVFDRMIAERQRIAAMYRSEGDGKSAEIRGQKERELKRIQSGAYKTAQEIKGRADGEATRIYAEAFNRDPEFYQFWKTLDTYRTTLDSNTWLLLSTNNEFFKFLKSLSGR